MKKSFILFLLTIISFTAKADNGHNLWLTGVAKDTKSLFQDIKVTLNGKKQLGDGYEVIIRHQPGTKTWTRRIVASSRQGAIYGAFALKRIEKTRLTENGHLTQAPVAIDITERPAYALRIINHWDNLDGSIERGYAGKSIFQSLTRQLLFLIPLLIVLPRLWGLDGVWATMPVSDTISFFTSVAMLWWLVRKVKAS